MGKLLKWLAWAMGVAFVGIGLIHFGLGIDSVPGEGSAGATVDSRERFYAAIFIGSGLAWIWVARKSPIPAAAVRWLAAIFLLGGLGRILSLVIYGKPQSFQLLLAVLEIVLPLVFFALAGADQKRWAASSEPLRETTR